MKLKILDKTGIILTNTSHARGDQTCSLKAEERCWVRVAVPGPLYF